MSVIDHHLFVKAGAVGCSNSDYHGRRTTCCGEFAVEDEELSQLYVDPTDLSSPVALWDPVPCPFCGATDRDLVNVGDHAAVPERWQGLCHSTRG